MKKFFAIIFLLCAGFLNAQINGAEHGTVHPHGIFKHIYKSPGSTVIILKTAGSIGYIGFESVTGVKDTASALPILVSTAANPYLNIYPDRATDSFYVKADTTIEYWIIKGNGVPVQGFGQGSTSQSGTEYVALLSQSGLSDPDAIVLRNTLGGVPTITREDVGRYAITLETKFDINNTVITIMPNLTQGAAFIAAYCDGSGDTIIIETFAFDGTNTDSGLINTPIKIEIL